MDTVQEMVPVPFTAAVIAPDPVMVQGEFFKPVRAAEITSPIPPIVAAPDAQAWMSAWAEPDDARRIPIPPYFMGRQMALW